MMAKAIRIAMNGGMLIWFFITGFYFGEAHLRSNVLVMDMMDDDRPHIGACAMKGIPPDPVSYFCAVDRRPYDAAVKAFFEDMK